MRRRGAGETLLCGTEEDLGLEGEGKEAGIDPRRQGGGQGVEDAAPPPTSDLGRDALPGPELEIGGLPPAQSAAAAG